LDDGVILESSGNTGPSDNTYFSYAGGANIYLDASTNTGGVNLEQFDTTGEGSPNIFHQNATDNLVNEEIIGLTSVAGTEYLQTGDNSENRVNDNLYVADNEYSNATYELDDGNLYAGEDEIIGFNTAPDYSCKRAQ